VFEVSERSSFENLSKWIKEFKEYGSRDSKVHLILIGNKIDKERKVTKVILLVIYS
jgi:GTPase SAR1 family protein